MDVGAGEPGASGQANGGPERGGEESRNSTPARDRSDPSRAHQEPAAAAAPGETTAPTRGGSRQADGAAAAGRRAPEGTGEGGGTQESEEDDEDEKEADEPPPPPVPTMYSEADLRAQDPKLQQLEAADRKLMACYGDTIHLNDGSHLTGSVSAAIDGAWQRR